MADDTGIRPFEVAVAQSEVDDLVDRLRRTRWPDQPPGTGWTRGVPVDYLRRLTDHWLTGYDWRAQEARLNRLPQHVTTIEGQPVHFLHVRSGEPDAVPLLLTHGWPSSAVEFIDVVAPLTDPRAHGGEGTDAFHLVVPDLPGYGFSTPVHDAGWGNLFRVAGAWAELMRRLGYDRYAVHGTDVGSGVALLLPMVDAERVIGTHATGTVPTMPFGPPIDGDGLSGVDRLRAERFNEYQRDGLGYLHLQATRPQTVAYALTDSPVALLAWITEKFREWTDPSAELPEDAVDLDHLLTLVTVSWFTRAGASMAHATYEGMQAYRQMAAHGGNDDTDRDGRHGPPAAVAVFAADNTIRSVMDPQGRIAHWSEFDRGGHFPAMEVPDLLISDLREFFRTVR